MHISLAINRQWHVFLKVMFIYGNLSETASGPPGPANKSHPFA